jgi:hypothetical protein
VLIDDEIDDGTEADCDDHDPENGGGEALAHNPSKLATKDRTDGDRESCRPRDGGGEDENDSGGKVSCSGEDDLESVRALDIAGQQCCQGGEKYDALGRAEVAPVDAGEADCHTETPSPAGPGIILAARTPSFEHGPNNHQHAGTDNEDRNDEVERSCGQPEEKKSSDYSAHRRECSQAEQLSTVAGEFIPIRDCPADSSRQDTDVVGDVGEHRRIPQRDKDRERHKRPRTNNRIDDPGRRPGKEENGRVNPAHESHTATRSTASTNIGFTEL